MSQIRKLQTGGKTNSQYGHLIIDGIDYGNSKDVYEQFANYSKLQDSSQGKSYAKWLEQLANGEDVVFGVDNTSNFHPDNMSDDRSGNRSVLRKITDDLLNTDRNQYSEAIATARQFVPVITPKAKNSKYNDASNFVFVGETPKYSKDDATNLALNERFEDYLNWLSDENWEKENAFTSSISNAQAAALKAWYNKLNGATPEEKRTAARDQWNAFLNKVQLSENGWEGVDDSAKNFFANFNIGKASTSSSGNNSSSQTEDEKKMRKLLKDAGYNEDLYKLIGNNFEIDKDGTLRAKTGVFDFGTGNIYFNDDFYNSEEGSDGRFDPLRGYTLYNGVLYKKNSGKLAQILNTSDGFNEAIRNGDYNRADSIIRTRFSKAAKENPGVLSQDSYSSFLTPSHRFSNLTGMYNLGNGETLNPGEQIVQYFDLNDTFSDGPYLNHNYKYGIFDSHGNKLRDITKEDLQLIPGAEANEKFLTYKKTTNANGKYRNKYYEDILGKNGEPAGIRVYRDIKNPNTDVILHIDGLKGPASGKDVILPEAVAKILMEDQSWVNKIVGNTQARQNFMNMLESLGESEASKYFDNWWEWSTPAALWRGKHNDVDYRLGKLQTFVSKEQAKRLQEALTNASKGNRFDRRGNYYIDTVEFKKGGKMEYISKLAAGGLAGGSKESMGVSERKIEKKVRNPKNASSLSEVGSDNWTSADSNDLMALGADLASLGLAFVPGANVASTATGVASSLARFEADRQRGTSGAGLQLGVNLAMDAATLLPFIGGAAKTGKVVKAVKSALPVIIKAASVYGLGSAVVTSAKKIANGEKFTVRDVSNVVNGITAGVALGRSGGFGKQSKSATKGYSEKLTVGDNEVSLNDTQLKEIMKAADQPKALREAISAQAKDASQEQIAKAAESLLKEKKTVWQRMFKKDGDIGIRIKKRKLPGREYTQQEITDMSNFERWWRGFGGYQQAYRRALINEQPSNVTTIRKTVSIPDAVNVGSKQIKFTKAEQADLQTTPVMQQFAKFKELAKSKAAGLTDADLETAFRSLLIETPKQFDILFSRAVSTVPSETAPSWYRGRTEGLSRVTNDEGVRTITRTRNYDTRVSLARPQVLLTKPRTDLQYEELPGTVYNPMYKNGGILKGQTGLKTKATDSELGLDTKWIDDDFYNNILPQAVSYTKKKPIFGDFNIDASKHLGNFASKALGIGEYLVKSKGRRNVHDIMDSALQRSNYGTPTAQLNQMPTNNPILEQKLSYLKQLNSASINPKVADFGAYLAGEQMKHTRLLPAINETFGQMSNDYNAKVNANLEFANKQKLMDLEAAKENLARSSSTIMNRAQNDASLELQDEMSKANWLREQRAVLDSELAKARQFAYNNAGQLVEDKYDRYWNGILKDKYNEWMNLDPDVRDSYTNVNDWLQRAPSNKGVWSTYEPSWNSIQKSKQDELLKLQIKYGLTDPIAMNVARKRYSLKRGGNVSKNRYKNEPEEDVWINQNKAVHKQVAKLNDNIIKLFLKTLK